MTALPRRTFMRKLLFLLAVVLTCHGCGPGVSRPSGNQNPDQHAQQLAASGDFQAAAAAYLRLAELYPKLQTHYTLLAASAQLNGGNTDAAGMLIDKADVTHASRDDVVRKNLLQAELDLARGEPAQTLSRTGAALPEGTSADLEALRHRIRARAYEAAHNVLNACRERASLVATLAAGSARDEAVQKLWAQLNSLDAGTLDRARSGADPVFLSWLELALINETMMAHPDMMKQSLESWIAAHPGHAAVPLITGRMLVAGERLNLHPTHIALLLPLSGDYQRASEAIRDGFLAAWYQDKTYHPSISVYDTNSLNITNVYRTAVAAGADFIVGPLEKSAVAQLVQMKPMQVTTLALNQDDAGNSGSLAPSEPEEFPSLMEFGLPPEDEARQAADRGIADGHMRALVITPQNDWGSRLYSAFASEWQGLGGMILEHVEYSPGGNDFSAPVSMLLNAASSAARAKELREKLGRRIHAENRIRKDADMIFMAATPIAARQIVPQFLYFGAGDISTYATSSAFSGIVDPDVDSDLDGIRFPDMPWLLVPDDLNSDLQTVINQNWHANASPLRRLYAFGADAFRLIPQLGLLATGANYVYPGLTGGLYMDPDDRIHRKLTWAQMVDGQPQLLNDNETQ